VKDVILIGSGIMSATLGTMLKSLSPGLEMAVYEANPKLGSEASDGWNNAGTGHAGICELYLTPFDRAAGTVDVSEAIGVYAKYFRSMQFWSHAVREGMIDGCRDFINPMPHMSFVRTAEQVNYLRKRYEALVGHHFFSPMRFSTDGAELEAWAPLLMDGRGDSVPVAASRMEEGTEVDFGSIARKLLGWLGRQDGASVESGVRVVGLRETAAGWKVRMRESSTGEERVEEARFVFVGAGGGSLPLLQKAGLAEIRGYGGFPVGGQWLVCSRPEIVGRHYAKVYGQAAIGTTPSMALPHLDTRIIGGERSILFGPFAQITTSFLRHAGDPLDVLRMIRADNFPTLLHSGLHNLPLLRYMLRQGTQSMSERIRTLQHFYPGAEAEDWRLVNAGIRVQVIKRQRRWGSALHFGTEIVTNRRHTLAALLGASPGASISAHLMLGVIRDCLPGLLESPEGRERMQAIMPGYDRDLARREHAAFFRKSADDVSRSLGLSVTASRQTLKPAIAG
jgi:malate dehydrogenase (quinone)